MENTNENLEEKIQELERIINSPDFWQDVEKAKKTIKELQELKDKKEGLDKYDKGSAILSIVSGAGGDDAEDFSRMLLDMYLKYIDKKGWGIFFIHENKNDHGGYRNVSLEIIGKGSYGALKNESGVHRLVRISPFNANSKRHTSFVLVEILPKFSKLEEKNFNIPETDLKIEFSRSGGPGGQNVNKRETAVRVVHIPTGISVHASGERSQEQNRERALSILYAKIFKKMKEEKKSMEELFKKDAGKDIEWGNQIRSYVLHPYKMVKDHRTGVQTSKIEEVLNGDLSPFIEAEKTL